MPQTAPEAAATVIEMYDLNVRYVPKAEVNLGILNVC